MESSGDTGHCGEDGKCCYHHGKIRTLSLKVIRTPPNDPDIFFLESYSRKIKAFDCTMTSI
jgi:hypothetical protein